MKLGNERLESGLESPRFEENHFHGVSGVFLFPEGLNVSLSLEGEEAVPSKELFAQMLEMVTPGAFLRGWSQLCPPWTAAVS